ncbi:MAG: FAD-dependent oxidoreductase [Phycisphaeraceae bacterium]|nr:FAD-dependent oxidoreductase [Phycisphaeraceae bacterium]
MADTSCIIVGGGLAGIAAAVRLAEAGVPVTVIETRQRLGGRATSFTDPTTGDTLDNCQHVLMRCCTHLLDLYRRLGVEDCIEWHDRFYFIPADGRVDLMQADSLPAPAHLARSLLGFKQFSLREKLAISRAMWAIMRCDRHTVTDQNFADWLRPYRQPQRVLEMFWSVVIVSACNEQLDRVSARYALQVFQDGFLRNRHAHEMGLPGPGVPLVKLYDPAENLIKSSGGAIQLSCSAEAFEFDGQRVTGLRLGDGQTLQAEWFISAVPFDRLDKLATPAPGIAPGNPGMRQADARLSRLDEITVSPIIGIHLYFDLSGVMTLPHAALTQSPLQWLFNKGPDPVTGKGQHLHGVISAAREFVDRSAEDLARMAVTEITRLFPVAGKAKLLHHRVVKEKRATFAITPGSDKLRPPTTGTIANLMLAGDWTDSGWPATMEGAVRSGYRAAGAVLGRDLAVPEVAASRLYRWLAISI